MICGFKECLICPEEQPAPSGGPIPPSAPLSLPPGGILEARTLSEECGMASTLSVTKRCPFDNQVVAAPAVFLTLYLPRFLFSYSFCLSKAALVLDLSPRGPQFSPSLNPSPEEAWPPPSDSPKASLGGWTGGGWVEDQRYRLEGNFHYASRGAYSARAKDSKKADKCLGGLGQRKPFSGPETGGTCILLGPLACCTQRPEEPPCPGQDSEQAPSEDMPETKPSNEQMSRVPSHQPPLSDCSHHPDLVGAQMGSPWT